jgi:phage shock protein PspC (stress-responsive transcriptional regulator)
VGGVCGGLAKYLGVDATLVRLVFVILTFGTGAGLPIYFVLWIVIPPEDRPAAATTDETVQANAAEIADRAREMGQELKAAARNPNPAAAMFFGVTLVGLGIVLTLENLHIPWLWWFRFDVLSPMLLILVGIMLVVSRLKGE